MRKKKTQLNVDSCMGSKERNDIVFDMLFL